MHSQENTLFDLDRGGQGYTISSSTLYVIWTMHLLFEVAMSNVLGEETITRNMTDKKRDWRMDDRQTLVQY